MERGRRWALPVLVCLAITTPSVQPAQAVFPGRPGRIAFNHEGDIYTIRPDGTGGLVRLTFDGRSLNPRWSPDGRRIAFNRGGNIYVMSSTGTNVRKLTTFGRSFQPAWSPDGTRIVFGHLPAAGQPGDLWIVRVSTGALTRLTTDGGTNCGNSKPVWSPLGGRIAYEQGVRSADGNCYSSTPPRVVVLTIATKARAFITAAWDPDFAADGKGVFFTTWLLFDEQLAPNLAWSNLTGGGREYLTGHVCVEGASCYHEGVGSPSSAFPLRARYAYTVSFLDGPFCVYFSSATGGFDQEGFCDDEIPVLPQNLDWQPALAA